MNEEEQLEQFEEGGDSDADAFAFIAIVVIIGLALAYYLNG